MYSARFGQLDVVDLLLNAGANVNQRDNERGATALNPLHIAAWSRSPRILKTLIEHGADINAQTTWGLTALIAVTTDDQSFRPAHAECTALLLERGAEVNAQDAEGNTPLMGAAWYGDLQVVKYPKEHGAKLDITNARGHTAASKALTAGNMDIAEFLGVTA